MASVSNALDLNSLLGRVNQFVVNPIIILLFVVALLVFFWGLVGLIVRAGDEEGRATGRRHMLWGIFGMFIMFTVYGLIRLILTTFGIPAPTFLGPVL